MLDGIDNAHATDNLWGERWTKLCVNGMRNGVSAATGMGGNARDSHDAIRAYLHQARAASRYASVRRWDSRWARSARWSRRSWRWHRKAIAARWRRSRR